MICNIVYYYILSRNIKLWYDMINKLIIIYLFLLSFIRLIISNILLLSISYNILIFSFYRNKIKNIRILFSKIYINIYWFISYK